jgi:orotate phosphoribosyltransferase
MAYASAQSAQMIRAFTVRKEPKVHGTGQLIEGPFKSGDRVAIVEDVITTGASTLKAAAAVQAAGGIVAGVLAVVDREEGGREALVAAGFSVISLTRAADVLKHMPPT